MYVEVDQSGKIEATSRDAVVAFSNDEEFAILIPAKAKQEMLVEIRAMGAGRRPYLVLLAMALYELLKGHLRHLRYIVIDVEYQGREAYIKSELLKLIRRRDPEYPADRIIFARISKKSPAHKKALATYRGKLEPDRTVTTGALKGLLR
jgi:hypothetical protein